MAGVESQDQTDNMTDTDSDTDTEVKSLFQAVENNDPTVVTTLLSSDSRLVNCTDTEGWTALHKAAKRGYSDICNILIEHGAQVQLYTTDVQLYIKPVLLPSTTAALATSQWLARLSCFS